MKYALFGNIAQVIYSNAVRVLFFWSSLKIQKGLVMERTKMQK
jgi:hypothetical protein